MVVLVTLVACAEERIDRPATAGPILVAVLPDQSKDTLLSQYTPLLGYLESVTSLEFEPAIPPGYSDLLDQFDYLSSNSIQCITGTSDCVPRCSWQPTFAVTICSGLSTDNATSFRASSR